MVPLHVQIHVIPPEIAGKINEQIARETVGKINEQLNIAGSWQQSPILSFLYNRILEALARASRPIEAREALRQVRCDHENKKIELPPTTHAIVCAALSPESISEELHQETGTKYPRSIVLGLALWLKASLECKEHIWEPDQRAAAQGLVDEALISERDPIVKLKERVRNGPKTLEAKWLDPECWDGCQSLVFKGRVKDAFEKVRSILKERSKGEVDTWGAVASFMDMIDEAEKDFA